MLGKEEIKGLRKAAIILFILSLFCASVYHIYFAHRIIPGVYVGGVNVGRMNYSQAVEILKEREASVNKVLILRYQDKTFEIKGEDVGLEYSIDASISRAFEVGRTGNFFVDTKDKMAGLIKPLKVPAIYNFDDNAASLILSGIKGEINVDAKDAGFAIQGNALVDTPSVEGIRVNDQKLYEDMVSSLNNIDFSEKAIETNHVSPKIAVAEIQSVKTQTQDIVFNNIKLTYNKKNWYLDPQGILNLLRISRNGDKTELALNKPAFENYVVALSQEINELPKGEVTEYNSENKVVGFKITQNGKELDARGFSDTLKDAIFSKKTAVEIPVREVKSSDDPNKYGIFALLGEGKSTYKGSAAGRVHNLALAAERTNGVLVPPGGIYSLNKSVGEISAATGYNSAYIISGGRTVLGEGGGVCQTSTTLFRAILNAGLPIVMRYPHAYRVSYYEQDMPVGFDASVFQPSLDLQFKNDTPNYILVQAYPDTANYALTFRIFGTPDGRSVEISQPVISNVSGAPAPLYQDDPTLPKGVTKQVDFAAGGASVYFTRTVKNGDEVMFTDTFSSRYQPWRAVFLVGTKE